MSRAGKAVPQHRGTRNPAPFQLHLFPETERRPAAEPASKPAAESLARVQGPDAEAFRHRLRAALPRLGSVALTDNRSTIVSAREAAGGRLDVRIQRCFASAPDETLSAVATFLTSAKGSRARRLALATIREYFAAHGPEPVVQKRRRVVLRPVGQALDLRQVRDHLNRRYFDSELAVDVTWGRAPSRRRRRRRKAFSVRLGTYGDHDKVVRIHRCLDRADVPRYVVEAVVYHEMLHAAMPPVVENGRRRIHTPEFRRLERLFPSYQRAERWIDRNLKRLI